MSTALADIQSDIARWVQEQKLSPGDVILVQKAIGELLEERNPWPKVFRWIIYSVLFALIPIVCSYVSYSIKGIPPELRYLLVKGELLLVSVGIGGAAVGELIHPERKGKHPNWEILIAGACVMFILGAAIIYAGNQPTFEKAATAPQNIQNIGDVVQLIVSVFGLTVASSTLGIYVKEL